MVIEATTPRRSPAVEAWGLMVKLMQSRKGGFMAIAAEFGLSTPQMLALRSLEPGTPAPMSALAELLHCDNSNITGIVDRMEDRGLVERRPAAHDRRVKHIVVTEKGAELRTRLLARMEKPPEEFDRLSAADQRRLRDLMRRALGEG